MLNDVETDLIDDIDDLRLFEAFLPSIKAIIKAGGGADQIIKGSSAMAATRLATNVMTGSPEVSTKAAIALLNWDLGRPVERHINLFADVAQMSNEQLDREIYQLAKRAGVQEEVINLLQEPKKQKSKAARVSLSAHPDGSRPIKNTSRKKKVIDVTPGEGRTPQET